VGEAFGDPEELKGIVENLSFEMKPSPFTKVGRVTSKIDGDIPDMAG
jgi:hypothetical protein